LEIVKTRSGGIVHLRLIGRLDNHWSQSLDEVLHESAREGARHVRLDFSAVTYLSSAGAAVLLKHQNEAMAMHGSLEISAASERARSTLRLMGFVELLVAGASTSARRKTLSIPLPLDSESATYESRVLDGKKTVCSVVGNPDQPAQASAISIYRDVFALGVGALGATPDECRDFAGEFVGAAGGAAFMPTDGTATPDYMLSTPMGLVPTIQAVHAITFRGAPSYQLRFEANSPDAGVPLSDIVRTSISLAGTQTVGIVMAADITGLVCARLRQSPAANAVQFDFPAVRDWFSFTPEREFARFSSLVVGVASASPSAVLAPFLRPVSDEHQGHFHAVVTAFRSLPRGKLPVADIVTASLQPRSVVSVVHLLRDAREVEGAGESMFQRGACWIFPIAEGGGA
jgi:anti-sigma B factor antagonist